MIDLKTNLRACQFYPAFSGLPLGGLDSLSRAYFKTNPSTTRGASEFAYFSTLASAAGLYLHE